VFDIRSRVLLVALLPVTLLSVLLSAVFLLGRVGDLGEAHAQRIRSLARQVASASEYGLFSSNTSSLQTIATGALREADVRSVMILNLQGQALLMVGKVGYDHVPVLSEVEHAWRDEKTGHDLLVQPVMAAPLKLDDLFENEAKSGDGAAPRLLGYVVLEVSRQTMVSREHDMLLAGLAVTLGGLLFGGLLAVRIGQGVIRPILRVSGMIERLGHGELSVRGAVLPDDPLRDLQVSLNQMAERLEQGRDELERRVAQATRELREKKEEAESATLAKSRFLASASHDLRQPTQALGLFVERLAQLTHGEEARGLLAHLDASVRSLQDLLNALLDVSRFDAQAVQVRVSAFALMPLLEQLHANLLPVALEKGLRLRIRSGNFWVMSDAVLLQRILLNLVNNAVRYTSHGGVLVACRRVRAGRYLRIEVWDSGVGIAPEHQQEVFREFFQVGNAERDRNKGLGLGLNIVERTAHLLGHPLRLCSRLGQGSRFSIEVPLASPPPEKPMVLPPSARSRSADDLTGLRVLVIEDNELVSRALQFLLESWGCQVQAAEGLDEAKSLLAGGVIPDLVISDYRLREGANGIDAIRHVRALAGRPLPACLMSGDTDGELIRLAGQGAGLPLLHKPVRAEDLRGMVQQLARAARTR
jgi:signal transduction histidine kinase/CheY-like chemotaxis protein